MKFRKKPIVVEAEQFTEANKERVFGFVGTKCAVDFENGVAVLRIHTLEGTMTARLGDWVIKGIKGEFYPHQASFFEEAYEEVKE